MFHNNVGASKKETGDFGGAFVSSLGAAERSAQMHPERGRWLIDNDSSSSKS